MSSILTLAKEFGQTKSKRSISRSLTHTRNQRYGWMFSTLPAVHLANTRGTPITRASGSKAHKLNESGQPAMRSGTSAVADPSFLTSIVNWLDVEHSQRYQPAGGATYCNIYAYDFCCFAGAYIPRVWWKSSVTSPTPAQISNPRYDVDVQEKNANALYDWFIAHGANFGWAEESPGNDFTSLQNLANAGHICLIVYKNSSGHGHICAIVPEVTGHAATRSGTTVTHPLQSQAGATNHKYRTTKWWSSYTNVKFWVNRLPLPSGPIGAGVGAAVSAVAGPIAGAVAGGVAGAAESAVNAVLNRSQSYSDAFDVDEGKNFNYQDQYEQFAQGATYSNQLNAREEFFNRYSQMAIDSMRATSVPASVTLAQAALESGWGAHAHGNNFFGIKAGRNWTGRRQLLRTREVHNDDDRSRHAYPEVISITRRDDGRFLWVVRDYFRAYDTATESFNDHGNLLRNARRYQRAFQHTTDGMEFAREVARAGYATDPNYATTLTNLIRQYNLTRFDRQ